MLSATINPRSIARYLGAAKGDVILYNPVDCTRLGDGATTTFSLDSEGVPTVVGVNGTLGYPWGAYECGIKFNGTAETATVHHTEDATIRASFSFNLDANGWTDITPPSGARLIYVNPDITGFVIDGQDETSYDNSPTTEGTFAGGTGHAVSDVITVTNGTTVTVDAVDGGNAVTQFTVDATADTGGNAATNTLSQTGTTGSGTGFSLTLDTDNLRTAANQGPAGNDTDFYIMGTNDPAGGWKTPTNMPNCYETMAEAYADMRDGNADYMLLYDGAVHAPTAKISFNGKSGVSASQRLMITSFGAAGTGRAHINPPTTHTDDILELFAEEFIGFTDLDIYPTWHDPTHGDWNGWGVDTPPGRAIVIYTGGGAIDPELSGMKGILIENCRIRYCGGGISATGQSGLHDCIIRRNVIEWNFDEGGRAHGFSFGGRREDPLEYPVWSYYIGENFIDHNGWYNQVYDISGTATSGGTTTLTDTGAFTGLTLDTVYLADTSNGGNTTIVSNTNDTITFNSAANVDFTGGGNYQIGQVGVEDNAQGQATAFNHNFYVRYSGPGAIVEKNVISRSSSISLKNTSDTAGTHYLINGQTEVNYNSAGNNGNFTGGTGWIAGDVGETITVTYGSVITIDAVSGGAVTEFTVDSSADSGGVALYGTVSQTSTTGSGTGFSLTIDLNNGDSVEELDANNHPTDSLIKQYNLINDCEVGIFGGGNVDLSTGPRFNALRDCCNVIINMGASNPTQREVGWGSRCQDWRNGFIGGNIALNTSAVATNGPDGFALAGHCVNFVMAKNVSYNCGQGSTAANTGAVSFSPVTYQTSRAAAGFQDVYVIKNDFVDSDGSKIVGNFPASAAEFTMTDNRYDFTIADASATYVDSVNTSFSSYLTASGETGSKQTITYSNASATIETYQTFRGGTATIAAFLAECVGQSKTSWDDTLLGDAIYGYFIEAFTDA